MADQQQHYIPQFYLRAFRDPTVPEDKGPWLWMADFEEKTVQLRSPKAVGKQTNYYAFPEAEAAAGESVETILGKFESVAAPVTKRLITSATMSPEKQDRADLLFFMAFLVVRVPTFRDAMEKFFVDIAKGLLQMSAAHPEYFERTIRQALQGKEDDITPEKIEQYRRFILDDSKYKVTTSPKLSLGTGFEVVLDTIYPVFDKMRWAVVRSPGISGFITSDTPVSWVDPTIPFPYAMGLVMPKTEVTFPIDPSTCVLGTWEGSTGAITADDKTVSDYNVRRVMFASRYAFAVTEQAARLALDVRRHLHAKS